MQKPKFCFRKRVSGEKYVDQKREKNQTEIKTAKKRASKKTQKSTC